MGYIGYIPGWSVIWVGCGDYTYGSGTANSSTTGPGTHDENTIDPISTISGNVYMDDTDLDIPCPGLPLQFRRTYNSRLDRNGTLGPRWTHSYEWSLSSDTNLVEDGVTNTYRILLTGEGSVFRFKKDGNNYHSPYDNNWRLTTRTNGAHEVTVPGGAVFAFGTNGLLTTISDPWNNVVTLTYTNVSTTSLVARVAHRNGLYLNLVYTSNLLSRVETPSTNLALRFSFNAAGELTNATRSVPSGAYADSYRYDSATNYRNHSLTQHVNAIGDAFYYAYATNAAGQLSSTGISMVLGTNYYKHNLQYSANNNSLTTLTYARGSTNQVYKYYFAPYLHRVSMILGPEGCDVQHTHVFDADGNLRTEKVASPASGDTTWHERQYDACHNVTNEAFGCGNVTPTNFWNYAWDTNWQVCTSMTDPQGRKTGFDYTNASVSRIKLYYNATQSYDTVFSYTTNGLVSGVTNANGHWINTLYDSCGFPTSSIPQVGPTVGYEYTSLGYLKKIILPSDVYDQNFNMVPRVTAFDRNELGWVTKVTYPAANGLCEYFYYDKLGNVTNHIDTGGRATRFAYQPTRKLSSVSRTVNGTNIATSISYDNQFNTLKITDAKGRAVETYVLDIQDRATSVTNLEGQRMAITYGIGDYVKSVSRFDGTLLTNTFNSDGMLVKTACPGLTNTYTWLRNGLLATASNSWGTISNRYDGANRLAEQVSTWGWDGMPRSVTLLHARDGLGQVTNRAFITTAATNVTTYARDEAERLTRLTAQRGSATPLDFNWTYNTNNGLAAGMTCTNNGLSVSYSYDLMDRPTAIVWTDSSNCVIRSFSYTYNSAGMISGEQWESGERIEYSYDDLDRLTGEKHISAVGQTISEEAFSYDEVGNRTSKTRDGITVNYSYSNGNNRLTGWKVPQTNLTASVYVHGTANEPIGTNPRYGYLWVSNRTAVTPSVDGTNFWVYDLDMNLGTQKVVAAIRDRAGNTSYATNQVVLSVVTNGTYLMNSAGCVTSIVYQGKAYGDRRDLTWDGQYRLASLSANGATVESYTYDALGGRGNRTDLIATNAVVNGSFTSTNNWSKGTGSKWVIASGRATFTMAGSCSNSNLWQNTGLDLCGTTCTLTFKTSLVKQGTGSAFAIVDIGVLDDEGNMQWFDAAYAQSNQWENFSFRFYVPKTRKWKSIVFYPSWSMNAKSVSIDDVAMSVNHHSSMVYDGVHAIADMNSRTFNPDRAAISRTYTWGPGIDNLLAFTTGYGTSSTNTYFALTDHLGTVHALTDFSGNIVESYRYDAWGRVLGVYNGSGQPLTESAVGNRILWQGREYSWKTGLYNFRARWYDPITGRWLSNDPIGISGGLNQYVFCANNPVMLRDPFGLCGVTTSNGEGDMSTTAEDGTHAAQLYARDLMHDRPFIWQMPTWSYGKTSEGTPRDTKWDQRTWNFFGHALHGDQQGNAQAGYAFAAVYGSTEAWVVTRGAEIYFGIGDFFSRNRRGTNWRADMKASFEMNDLGIAAGEKDYWKYHEIPRIPSPEFGMMTGGRSSH